MTLPFRAYWIEPFNRMQTLSQLQELFQQYFDSQPLSKKPKELYAPIEYGLETGGKRLRPLLCLWGCRLVSERCEGALPAAFAIELFHNFTLLHDDIMDSAPLRRGKDSAYIRFGANQAILSGDAMLILAYEYLRQVHLQGHLPLLLKLFNRTALQVCEGQQLDMNFEKAEAVSLDQYLEMIELKTAVLLGCALQMGGLIGGASEESAEHLFEFGKEIGIAFQIQDDLLDTFGHPSLVGKKVGGDIAQNKMNFLRVKAMEMAPPALRERLNGLFREKLSEEEKIRQVIAVYEELGLESEAREEKRRHFERGLEFLERAPGDEAVKRELRAFAEDLLERVR